MVSSASISDSAASIREKSMAVLGHGFNYYNLIKPKPPYGASKRKMSMPVKQCIRPTVAAPNTGLTNTTNTNSNVDQNNHVLDSRNSILQEQQPMDLTTPKATFVLSVPNVEVVVRPNVVLTSAPKTECPISKFALFYYMVSNIEVCDLKLLYL